MIVITTPTGQIGRRVRDNLLDSGEELRVIARDPSDLPAGVRDDLDIVVGSHGGIMSGVLGKEVRFQQTTFEAYKDRFARFRMSDAMAQGMTDMAWAKSQGLDNGVQRTSENSTPTSFRQWYEQALKPAVAS